MLSHEHGPAEFAETLSTPLAEAEMRMANAHGTFEDMLEDAVDQACLPLIGTLPRADRLKRRAALRQEIYTLFAAHRELTALPEQAAAEAIAHFARLHPAPVLNAAPVTQTNRRTTAQTASTHPSTLLALGLLLPAYVAIAYGWLNRLQSLPNAISDISLYRFELFAVPIFAGLLVGLLAQNRAARGVFNASAAIAAFAVLLPSIIVGLTYTHLLPFENHAFWEWVCPSPLAGYAGLVFWPLLGCAGAACGAKLRRRIRINHRGHRDTGKKGKHV